MNLNRLSKIRTRASLDRMLNRHYEGSLEAFFAELNKESDRLIRTDLNKARQLSDRTAGLESLLPDRYRAHLYRIWARHNHLSSNYSAARKLYLKAMGLFDKLRDHNSRARVQKALLDVLMYVGEYDQAGMTGRKSLRYFRRIGAEVDCAQVMTNLGNLYHRLDQNRKALGFYNNAYDIFKRLDNNYAMALVQFNMGNVYANLNDLNKAESLYHKAGSIYRSLGMELYACQTDYSLANIAFLKGSYSESVETYSQVANEFRRLGDNRCVALTGLDLMEVYLHLNLYSQVINDGKSVAKEFRRLKMSYERAKAYYFAANGYFAYGDFSMAAGLARRSLALFKREQNQPWLILCRFLLAKIDCREGRISEALGEFRKIAAFYRRQGDIRHYYDARLAWLEALILIHDYAAATRLINSFDKMPGRMAGYQKFIYYMLIGDMHRDRSDSRRAANFYRRAVRQAEKLRAAIFPDEIRRFFWLDKLAAYNRLAAIYLDEGKNRQAFQVLEKGKAAASLNTRSTFNRISDPDIPPELDEERKRLKAYLRRAIMPVGTSIRSVVTTRNIHSTEHRLWNIERELRRRGSVRHWNEVGGWVSIEAVQRKLGPEDVLIQYVCREESHGLFVIGNGSFEYIPFETRVEELRGLLARLYFLINRVGAGKDEQPVIASLVDSISKRIWIPAAANISGCKRLFIVPDGILARLPFYILKNSDGTLLFESYDTYLFSSTSDLARHELINNVSDMIDKASIIAISDDNLPGATLESIVVSRHLAKPKIFSGNEATCANLFSSLATGGGLVHLIAHAAQSYENYLFSRILLSDGPLYPFDLMARPVRSGLVVLSGCQTGDPGLYYYSDSQSLGQTFLLAGAREVIASYWPVTDKVTCRFMDAFYGCLTKEANVYHALRKAIVNIRSQSDDIRHWAAFYLACR